MLQQIEVRPPGAQACDTFGAQLYALRRERNATQKAFGRLIGVSRAYVGDIENERRLPPDIATVGNWAFALSLTPQTREQLVHAATVARLRSARSLELIRLIRGAAAVAPGALYSLLSGDCRGEPTMS